MASGVEWFNTAVQNLEACVRLQEVGQLRSATSRAYYAAHHAVHAALIGYGEPTPSKGNWPHGELPGMLRACVLRSGSVKAKPIGDFFHQSMQDAYNLRIQADYHPEQEVVHDHVNEARRHARQLIDHAREMLNAPDPF